MICNIKLILLSLYVYILNEKILYFAQHEIIQTSIIRSITYKCYGIKYKNVNGLMLKDIIVLSIDI